MASHVRPNRATESQCRGRVLEVANVAGIADHVLKLKFGQMRRSMCASGQLTKKRKYSTPDSIRMYMSLSTLTAVFVFRKLRLILRRYCLDGIPMSVGHKR